MASHPALPARRGARAVARVVVLLAATGCGGGSDGARLTASWTGSDTGRLAAPATAIWCPVASRLEVKAVRQDVGFGLVVYPRSDLAVGDYPAFDPGIDSVLRPGASGAARWYSEQEIVGYQSDSGSVGLTRSGDRLQLRFGFRMRSLEGKDTIRATGKATGLVPGPCPADSVPNATPTQ
jgi:hypothetical protein